MHGRPAGQMILAAHEPVSMHWITHASVHALHAAGHIPPSPSSGGASGAPVDTHQPSWQTRAPGQVPSSQR
jgi:hypothetical protein